MKHPTDEDIEKYAAKKTSEMGVSNNNEEDSFDAGYETGIIEGAKWVRDQQPKTIESLENQLQASRQTEEINGKWYEDMINDLKAQKEIDRQEIDRLKALLWDVYYTQDPIGDRIRIKIGNELDIQ